MLYYITPREDLLKPVKELEGTSHADDEKYIYRYVPLYSLLSSNTERDKLYMKRMDKWNDPLRKKFSQRIIFIRGKNIFFIILLPTVCMEFVLQRITIVRLKVSVVSVIAFTWLEIPAIRVPIMPMGYQALLWV